MSEGEVLNTGHKNIEMYVIRPGSQFIPFTDGALK